MIDPLVSIMMPCFNERASLPRAIASVLAQTHMRWELVFVDDGSTDGSSELVRSVCDPRIRVIRLPENRGHGVARQTALDASSGDYLCMLDADDWMYPSRIATELQMFAAHPELTLVSAGMAIVDHANTIQRVRCTGDGQVTGPHRGVRVPVAHAPSMYRSEDVASLRFDGSRGVAEDVDFLLRLLQGRSFAVLPSIQYAYSELTSVSAESAVDGHRKLRRTVRKYARAQPTDVARVLAASYGKQVAYQAAAALGLGGAAIQRRSRRPTDDERAQFGQAWSVVSRMVDLTFGQTSVPSGWH
jgi:glycosyltransferase involved in cell wall biosynthesis